MKEKRRSIRDSAKWCINEGLYGGRKNLEYGIRKKVEEIKNDNKKK